MALLMFSVVSADYASQAVTNPCEALTADHVAAAAARQATEQQHLHISGFVTYSIMVNLGSCAGFVLAAIDWRGMDGFWGDLRLTPEQAAFILATVIYGAATAVTLSVAREAMTPQRSPAFLPDDDAEDPALGGQLGAAVHRDQDHFEGQQPLLGAGQKTLTPTTASNSPDGFPEGPANVVVVVVPPPLLSACPVGVVSPASLQVLCSKRISVSSKSPAGAAGPMPSLMHHVPLCGLLRMFSGVRRR